MSTSPRRKSPTLYFTRVVALEPDCVMLVAHLISEGTDPTFSRVIKLDRGTWSHVMDIDEIVYGTEKKPASIAGSVGSVYFLGRQGLFRELSLGGQTTDERIDVQGAGYLMTMKLVGDNLYAAGIQNIVVKRGPNGRTRMDRGIFRRLGDEVHRGINGIDGFSSIDIYAAGLDGSIYHWNGRSWRRSESPTNVDLTCVLCTSSGDVVIAGGGGIVLIGNFTKGWRELTDPSITEETIESAVELYGRPYLGTDEELLRVAAAGTLEAIRVPARPAPSFSAMDVAGDTLWAVGDKFVGRFNGTTWSTFVCPDTL
jgi:hypothetical protein